MYVADGGSVPAMRAGADATVQWRRLLCQMVKKCQIANVTIVTREQNQIKINKKVKTKIEEQVGNKKKIDDMKEDNNGW